MSATGRRPMPTEVAILRGVRSSRINRAQPQPLDLPPDEPAGLSDGALVEWRRVIPNLVAMGTAKAVDSVALAGYCEAAALFYRLAELVDRDGPVVYDPGDGLPRKNPAVALMMAASHELRMWAREFGFTPSARTPLRVEHSHTVAPAERLLS